MLVAPSEASLIEHIDCLYGYGLVLSCDGAIAQQLVWETYHRAATERAVKRNRSDTKTWLIATLRRVWVSGHCERTGSTESTRATCGGVGHVNSCDAHSSSMDADNRARIVAAIQQLPEDLRELIVLRECEQLSYDEIAKVVNLPEPLLMPRLRRAREILKGLVGSVSPEPDGVLS